MVVKIRSTPAGGGERRVPLVDPEADRPQPLDQRVEFAAVLDLVPAGRQVVGRSPGDDPAVRLLVQAQAEPVLAAFA
ncbi:hypothetical protein [Streptomyces sp. NPDC001274]